MSKVKENCLDVIIRRMGFENEFTILYAENMDKYDDETCVRIAKDICVGRDPRKESYWKDKPTVIYTTKEQVLKALEELENAKFYLWMKDYFTDADWEASHKYDEEIAKLTKILKDFE